MSTERTPTFEPVDINKFLVIVYDASSLGYDALDGGALVWEEAVGWTYEGTTEAQLSAFDLSHIALKLFELNGK